MCALFCVELSVWLCFNNKHSRKSYNMNCNLIIIINSVINWRRSLGNPWNYSILVLCLCKKSVQMCKCAYVWMHAYVCREEGDVQTCTHILYILSPAHATHFTVPAAKKSIMATMQEKAPRWRLTGIYTHHSYFHAATLMLWWNWTSRRLHTGTA